MFLSRRYNGIGLREASFPKGCWMLTFSFIADNNLPDNNTSATKFLEEENVSYGNEEDEGNDNQQEEVDVPFLC